MCALVHLCVGVCASVPACVCILTRGEQDDGGDDEEADDEDDEQGDYDAPPVPLGGGAADQVLPKQTHNRRTTSKHSVNTQSQHTASDGKKTNAHKTSLNPRD